jgi:hypothetical protein
MLTMDQVAPFVEQTLKQIYLGCYNARMAGIFADLPDSIEVTATIVTKPQFLAIVTTSQTASKNREGGGTTEQQTGTETTTSQGQTVATSNRATKTIENGSQSSQTNTSDVSEQTTSHGETVRTTGGQGTQYTGDDASTIGSSTAP